MCVRDKETKKTFLACQLALLIFALLAIPMRLYPQFHPDLMDGLRGLFIGIAIATLYVAGRARNRRHPA